MFVVQMLLEKFKALMQSLDYRLNSPGLLHFLLVLRFFFLLYCCSVSRGEEEGGGQAAREQDRGRTESCSTRQSVNQAAVEAMQANVNQRGI